MAASAAAELLLGLLLALVAAWFFLLLPGLLKGDKARTRSRTRPGPDPTRTRAPRPGPDRANPDNGGDLDLGKLVCLVGWAKEITGNMNGNGYELLLS